MCRSYSCLLTLPSQYLIIIIRLLVLLFETSTVLFLVLPGVSGNKTGFYWVNIEYEGNEGAWDIGALGNCQYGTEYAFSLFFSSFRLRGIARGRDDGESRVDDYCLTDVRLLAR